MYKGYKKMNAQFDSTQAVESITTTHGLSANPQKILQRAQHYADENELDFTGSVPPVEAWCLVEQGHAVLVDVRTSEERKFVGYVPESIHVAWATGPTRRSSDLLKARSARIKPFCCSAEVANVRLWPQLLHLARVLPRSTMCLRVLRVT